MEMMELRKYMYLRLASKLVYLVRNYMCGLLVKLGKMHVRELLSKISLCSLHKIIIDKTFCLNWIFV